MSGFALELDRPGRHRGALTVPFSTDRSAYGQLVVPMVSLVGVQPGRTVLLVAGVHGDEYEGQLVLAELARDLDPAGLRGRVLVMPRANPLACRAGRRTSPADGGNLARLFPGDPRGSVTAALADAISRHLLPLADAVLDLHAGGCSLEYLPCAWGRLPADRGLAAAVLGLLLAFGGDMAAVVPRPDAGGTLVAAALAAGTPAIAAELGGGGTVTPRSLDVGRVGCMRVLCHLGVIDAPTVFGRRCPGLLRQAARNDEGGPPALVTVYPRHLLRSPAAGLFEPCFALGQVVGDGELAGWLHDPERAERAPEPLAFPAAGRVICRRVPTACEPGDVLAHLAEAADRDGLLAALSSP